MTDATVGNTGRAAQACFLSLFKIDKFYLLEYEYEDFQKAQYLFSDFDIISIFIYWWNVFIIWMISLQA